MDDKIKVHLGGDGVPFLTSNTNVPDYKNALPSRLQPQSVRKTRVHVLDLSQELHYSFYSSIWDAVGLGIATVVEEDKHWMSSTENWKIFIRWFVNSKMDPAELRTTRLEKAQAMMDAENFCNFGDQ